jgi:hypothetical protein
MLAHEYKPCDARTWMLDCATPKEHENQHWRQYAHLALIFAGLTLLLGVAFWLSADWTIYMDMGGGPFPDSEVLLPAQLLISLFVGAVGSVIVIGLGWMGCRLIARRARHRMTDSPRIQ